MFLLIPCFLDICSSKYKKQNVKLWVDELVPVANPGCNIYETVCIVTKKLYFTVPLSACPLWTITFTNYGSSALFLSRMDKRFQKLVFHFLHLLWQRNMQKYNINYFLCIERWIECCIGLKRNNFFGHLCEKLSLWFSLPCSYWSEYLFSIWFPPSYWLTTSICLSRPGCGGHCVHIID